MPNYPTGHVFPEYRKSFYRRETWENIPVYRVWLYPALGAGFKRLLSYASFTLTSLIGLMRANKPDYIFVESPPLFLSLPAVVASTMWGVPFIFNVADLWPDAVQDLGVMEDSVWIRLARVLERWSYRKAAYVNAVTEGVRSNLIQEKGVPREKLLFLPNGVDTDLFKPTDPDPVSRQRIGLDGKKVVLYAGNHGFSQAIEYTLYAATLLSEERDIHFLFVGGGSEKARLIKLAQSLCLHNVTFMAPVPVAELPRLISIAYCGLVSLRNGPTFEGTRPAKALALMACAKPIVLAAKGEAARLIEAAKAGIVVPPENSHALADAILTLVKDPALAAEHGRNARTFVEGNLRWHVLVQDWLGQLPQNRRLAG
jgi:glycosyltransferase involved in cell wall biosynthesis